MLLSYGLTSCLTKKYLPSTESKLHLKHAHNLWKCGAILNITCSQTEACTMKQMLILHSLTIPGMVGNYFTENKLVIIGCFKVVRPVQALQALSPFLGSSRTDSVSFQRSVWVYVRGRALLSSVLLKVLYQCVSALHALVTKTGQHLFFLLPPKWCLSVWEQVKSRKI